ncbi:MAG: hypothetical protein VB009_06380 [Erysipelotrichaceae bacterium]|nr:hypothetical protein [Erysipelotrichaceae bacterium]
MRSIYILLTKSNSYFSRLIHYITADEFTHCSIALDRELKEVYSFGRRYPRLMWPAGFVKEDVRSGLFKWGEENDCCLYELIVTDDAYIKIEEELKLMSEDPNRYQYNLLGTLFCKINYEYKRKDKYFCSEFVGELLIKADALELPKSPSFIRPVDFCELEELTLLYKGELKHCIQ